MNSYQSSLNKIALSVLLKPVKIPDYHLMVGTAEHLASIDLVVPQQKVSIEIAKNMSTINQKSQDEILLSINEQTLEIDEINDNLSLIGGA